jgi:hypothetical protein
LSFAHWIPLLAVQSIVAFEEFPRPSRYAFTDLETKKPAKIPLAFGIVPILELYLALMTTQFGCLDCAQEALFFSFANLILHPTHVPSPQALDLTPKFEITPDLLVF